MQHSQKHEANEMMEDTFGKDQNRNQPLVYRDSVRKRRKILRQGASSPRLSLPQIPTRINENKGQIIRSILFLMVKMDATFLRRNYQQRRILS